jgi:hypothetical protein
VRARVCACVSLSVCVRVCPCVRARVCVRERLLTCAEVVSKADAVLVSIANILALVNIVIQKRRAGLPFGAPVVEAWVRSAVAGASCLTSLQLIVLVERQLARGELGRRQPCVCVRARVSV